MIQHLLAFGFGAPMEWLVIAGVVLIIFGPKKLPEFARSIGKSVGELKKGIDESKETFNQAINSTPVEPAVVGAAPVAGAPVVAAPVAATPVAIEPEKKA